MEIYRYTKVRLLAFGMFLALSGGANADLFENPVPYAVGSQPRDVVCADVDRDYRFDLIVANEVSQTISVLRNNGDGTFLPAAGYSVAGRPLAVAAARLDADLFPDVIATNSTTSSISVLINNGDGTFADPVNYTTGSSPWGVVAAELNGDGHTDVAVVNRNSDSFSVYLNNGDGTLTLAGSYPAGGAYIAPSWLTVGLFDDDDNLDIAVVKNYQNLYFFEGYVQIFMNDGFGAFTSVQTITTGRTATTPIAADFDGDEDIDLAVSGFVDNSYKLSLLLNDGNGIFADPITTYAGASGRATGGDFDCDGDLDVLISEEGVYAYSFSVLLNHGDGTFADAFTVAIGPGPMGLIGGDFDGDNDLDVAVTVKDDNLVTVARNTTDPPVAAVADPVLAEAGAGVRLLQSAPNPFLPGTAIRYVLPRTEEVRLAVTDVQGRLTRVLATGLQGPGVNEARWDGRNAEGRQMPSGVYVYRLQVGSISEGRSMLMIR